MHSPSAHFRDTTHLNLECLPRKPWRKRNILPLEHWKREIGRFADKTRAFPNTSVLCVLCVFVYLCVCVCVCVCVLNYFSILPGIITVLACNTTRISHLPFVATPTLLFIASCWHRCRFGCSGRKCENSVHNKLSLNTPFYFFLKKKTPLPDCKARHLLCGRCGRHGSAHQHHEQVCFLTVQNVFFSCVVVYETHLFIYFELQELPKSPSASLSRCSWEFFFRRGNLKMEFGF